MGKIAIGRVILGGLVAGLIANVFEDVLNGVVIADQWPQIMASLHRPMIGHLGAAEFNALGFILGLAAIWTYAAIRPRFGAGAQTAITAALLVWVTGYVVPIGTCAVIGVYPPPLAALLLAVGLVEIVLGTLAGAWLYTEA